MAWVLRLPKIEKWKTDEPLWGQEKTRWRDENGEVEGIEEAATALLAAEDDSPTEKPVRFQEIDIDDRLEEWRVARHPSTGEEMDPYYVSNYGRVCKRRGDLKGDALGSPGYGIPSSLKLFEPTKNKDGYRRFYFGRSTVYLHRAVARTFLGSAPDHTRLEVDHIDANRWNNSSANLRWVTHQENEAAKRSQGGDSRLMNKTEYAAACQLLKGGYPVADIAVQLGRDTSTIHRLKQKLQAKGEL